MSKRVSKSTRNPQRGKKERKKNKREKQIRIEIRIKLSPLSLSSAKQSRYQVTHRESEKTI